MGARPVEAHAALCGIHGLGDGEAEIDEVMAEGEGLLPVEDRRGRRLAALERIDHDMGGGEGYAVEALGPLSDLERRADELVVLQRARPIRKLDRDHGQYLTVRSPASAAIAWPLV